MSATTFYLNSENEHPIAVHHWPATSPLRGVLHWLHGMSEHGLRYDSLAKAVNAAGWEFYAHDHRGHGLSINANAPQGHFADQNGWQKVQSDMSAVQQWIRQQHPDTPIALGGHSMGSFIALNWAQNNAEKQPLAGLILCGSDYRSPYLHALATLPIRLERWRLGARQSSPLVDKLTFQTWAKKFSKNNKFAWISSIESEVATYQHDPLCGFECSTELWLQLLRALQQMHNKQCLATLPQNLPVLLLGGSDDPMSNFGKHLERLAQTLRKSGTQSAQLILYSSARHDLLHDVCATKAFNDLLTWLNSKV